MREDELHYETTEQDGFTIVKIDGSLTRANSEELRDRLEALVASDTAGVALDFEAVDYMDSSALGACAAVSKRMSREGARPFVMFGANRTVDKMWKLIGLDTVIPLLPDASAAVARMREAQGE